MTISNIDQMKKDNNFFSFWRAKEINNVNLSIPQDLKWMKIDFMKKYLPVYGTCYRDLWETVDHELIQEIFRGGGSSAAIMSVENHVDKNGTDYILVKTDID